MKHPRWAEVEPIYIAIPWKIKVAECVDIHVSICELIPVTTWSKITFACKFLAEEPFTDFKQ